MPSLPATLRRLALPLLAAAACAGPMNKSPVADAGAPQSVNTGAVVILDGSKSSDPAGLPLKYDWTLISLAEGSRAALSDAHAIRPSFIADMPGHYVAQLIVVDAKAVSATISTVDIVASLCGAGVPTTGTITASSTRSFSGRAITLGATPHDSDNDAGCNQQQTLSYAWSLAVPKGSTAQLSDATAPLPSFTADVEGTYTASLAVTDSTGRKSGTSSLAIVVANPSATKSTVALTQPTATADGVSKVTLKVHVADSTGTALAAIPVHVTATGAGVKLSPGASVSTNATGDASVDAVTAIAGAVTFAVDVDKFPGVPYGFSFSTRPVATFSAGGPATLLFVQQPGNTQPGATIPDFSVRAVDAHGNLVTNRDVDVTVAVGTNGGQPVAGTLSGTTTVHTGTTGVATFTGLAIDNPSLGYTLVASSSIAGVTSATTNTFTSVPPAPGTPTSFTVTGAVAGVNVAFTAPASSPWVASYQVSAGGNVLGTITAPATSGMVPLTTSGATTFTLTAVDVLGQTSAPTAGVDGKALPDTVTAALTSVENAANKVNFTWTASTDCCLTAYNVYANGTLVTTVAPSVTSFTDVEPVGTYNYAVTAVDSFGGESPVQTSFQATVWAPQILQFKAAATTVTSGSSTTLSATFMNGTATIAPGSLTATNGTPVSTGPLTADTTFTLTVKDALGTAVTSDPVTIHVVPAPTITSFSAPWPIITSGTTTSLTPVFANGTGVVDVTGPATSGTAIPTGALTADTTYTLTVTNPAGDTATQSYTVHVTAQPNIIGMQSAPAASCKQVFDADSSYGDGLYWIDGDDSGTPYQAYCNMSLDGGGYQVIYAGLNGKANSVAFGSTFGTTAVDCSDPQNHCVRRLPGAMARRGDLVVTCGNEAVRTAIAGNGFPFLNRGIVRNSWVSLATAPVPLTQSVNLASVTNFWEGTAGWIAGNYNRTGGVAFASTFQGDATWDYCNGNPDTTSAVRLLYREPSLASFGIQVPSTVSDGKQAFVVVTALDAKGQVVRSYRGTVHFTFGNAGYTLPDYKFTAADGGTHVFQLPILTVAGGNSTLAVGDVYRTAITGNGTLTVAAVTLGAAATPGLSCRDIQLSGSSTANGMYSIKPASSAAAFNAFCDMTTNGGGWTLVLSTRNLQGPQSAAVGVVDPTSGTTQAMSLANETALAVLSGEVHIRTAGLAATQSITSYPLTQPIQGLRLQKSLVYNYDEISESDWTGPYATQDHLWSTCGDTQGPFPSVYQSCGTNGMHLLGSSSRWNWNGGNSGTNVNLEMYLR